MQEFAKKPLIIAHRGASALAPENTFAAFQKAIDDDSDGIEFDVRLSSDRVPVVIHDLHLKRLANIRRRVLDLTAAELQKIDVGSWFNEKYPLRANDKFAAETVPTLDQLLDFLSGYKGTIYLELKTEGSEVSAFAAIVCDLLRQTRLLPNTIVKSFNLKTVKTVKEILPEARAAALFEPKIPTILHKRKSILTAARNCRADELSIHFSLATKKFVSQAIERNFPVTIWTADNPIWLKRAMNFGIKAIITNNPARLISRRDELLRLK